MTLKNLLSKNFKSIDFKIKYFFFTFQNILKKLLFTTINYYVLKTFIELILSQDSHTLKIIRTLRITQAGYIEVFETVSMTQYSSE